MYVEGKGKGLVSAASEERGGIEVCFIWFDHNIIQWEFSPKKMSHSALEYIYYQLNISHGLNLLRHPGC